ncbi:MAG TPA: ankyrin repeat domain-containing protein [Bryobacteraceae bacterium]
MMMFTKGFALLACFGLLAYAAPVESPSATEELFQAIRAGNRPAVQAALRKGGDVNGRDVDGATPLMYAALYSSDAASLQLLLNSGANPNAVNAFGATALLWGTGSLDKVKLLVEHGADVNARSKLGKTALLIAASRDGAGPVVSYLLAHGARADLKDDLSGIPTIPVGGGGTPALIQAAKARDGEALAALLKRGADVNVREKNGSTALLNAVASHNYRNAKLLITRGADVNASNAAGFSALILAAMQTDEQMASFLIDRGANVNAEDIWGNTALMWVAYGDRPNLPLVKMMVRAGTDINHKNKMGETALTWASRRGDTDVVSFLRTVSVSPGMVSATALASIPPSINQDLSSAIGRSLPMLQKGGPQVFKQRGCVSCHNNMLPAMAAGTARKRGHKIDEVAMEKEQKSLLSLLKPARELLIENGDNIPDLQITAPYALMALAAQGYGPDTLTDAMVHNLANKQNADGSWTIWAVRPPIENGDIQATALSLRALQLYPLEGRRVELETRMQKASQWLATANAENSSDQNWKLLGLFWAKADSKLVKEAAAAILRKQRADGGWAQLSSLQTDAYATGQSLYALGTTGVVAKDSEPWTRGITYLLRTQQSDGTWRVKSRAFPFQPYFESGFPYGADQWISSAGSSWATIALSMTEGRPAGEKGAGLLEASLHAR